jgi:hypothetical protein
MILKTLDIELANKNVFFRLRHSHRNLFTTLPKIKKAHMFSAEDVLTAEILNNLNPV